MAETQPLLREKMEFPPVAKFIPSTKRDASGRKIPQAIAHRGYKAAYPENTMGAFEGAVDIGACAIETDLHLSKDGVVVISHDATLKRCFGENTKIIDCEWDYLKTLRTLRQPHQAMPRLKDLLEFLATPGLEDIWILLDIKIHDDPDDMMRLLADTLADVKPTKPWEQRVVLGIWTANYLPLCSKYLPGYPIMHISVSIASSRHFFKVPNVSFNMHHKILAGPGGNGFLRDVKAANRSIVLWTVNEVSWMKWSIGKGVDGVVTDDPKTYLEVCRNYNGEKTPLSWKDWGSVIIARLFVMIFFRKIFGVSANMLEVKPSREPSVEATV